MKQRQAAVTSIVGKPCIAHVDDWTSGASTLTCPGIAGYKLQVIEDDERFSIPLESPDRRVFPLEYWEVVTRGFSTLGSSAEWRFRRVSGKIVPIALIVTVNAKDQSVPNAARSVQLLAVAQIRRDSACVVATLDASAPAAKRQARTIGDGDSRPCLTSAYNPHHPRSN